MSGKKDRNKGMQKAYSKLAGTDKPLMKEDFADSTEGKVEIDALGYEHLRNQLKKHMTLQNTSNAVHPEQHKPGHSLHSGDDSVRRRKVRRVTGTD
jgi:hypothetical protein